MKTRIILAIALIPFAEIGAAYTNPQSCPDVPLECIGKDLSCYQKNAEAPWYVRVRKNLDKITDVTVWHPYNAWILSKNDPKFNNPSPIICHYYGYDSQGKNLEIMLSYRVPETDYKTFAETHEFGGAGKIDNKFNKNNTIVGHNCTVENPEGLENTFGKNCKFIKKE